MEQSIDFMLLLLGGFVGSILAIFALQGILHNYCVRVQTTGITKNLRGIPAGAGLGFASIYLLCLVLYLSVTKQTVELSHWVFIACSAIIMLLGFFDDWKELPWETRLLCQMIIALISVYFLPPSELYFSDTIFDQPIIMRCLQFMGLLWAMNFFNFMDGVDGMVGSLSLVMIILISACFLLTSVSNNMFMTLQPLLLLAPPLMAFLLFNWAPAKTFMGDAGSHFLGYIFGVYTIALSAHPDITLWPWLILLGALAIDPSLAVLMRFAKRKNAFIPHKEFAFHTLKDYFLHQNSHSNSQNDGVITDIPALPTQISQYAAASTFSHRRVCFAFLYIAIFWLFPWAYLASVNPQKGLLYIVCAYLPLTFFAFFLISIKKATFANDKPPSS